MKKFYTLVSHEKTDEGYRILLDGRPVKTPARANICAPNEGAANLAVQEWAAQEDEIKPDTMPVTQILSTKIDRVMGQRDSLTPEVTRYFNTDLICYFHEGEPQAMAELQEKAWRPWLDWFEGRFGEALQTTSALQAVTHSAGAHEKVQAYINDLCDDRFTVLQSLVPACGSLVLSLAFIEGAMTPDELFNAARVEEQFKDELYKADFYGPDPSQEKKDIVFKRDLAAIQEFLDAL